MKSHQSWCCCRRTPEPNASPPLLLSFPQTLPHQVRRNIQFASHLTRGGVCCPDDRCGAADEVCEHPREQRQRGECAAAHHTPFSYVSFTTLKRVCGASCNPPLTPSCSSSPSASRGSEPGKCAVFLWITACFSPEGAPHRRLSGEESVGGGQ